VKEQERPDASTWSALGWRDRPQSIPHEVDGPIPWRETVLVGPDGKSPILERAPRKAGFRAPEPRA
jgi:hypothetical protein